ncbi:PAS domain S-box-containing protein [Flexibacter flexilis DSM 6793]|uniref:PAS domain S-box-containing protein n=1 Tax=Flexibacter flexilis DSM 6793 TaxID=927664 RepID=A0A1I1FSF1_9BACT|nr:PAS domain-containing protein [Flexibacter flexilis]SFB99920.1 PAS domain S-box-containing protein [Flexibacter flexilis DSM 6793]
MAKILQNLKTKQKLTLQGLFGISGLIVSFFVFFAMQHEQESRQKKLENYANINESITNVRTYYNILRGDIFAFFILDPVEEKDQIIQTQTHYNKAVNDLIQAQKTIESVSGSDEDLHKSAQEFIETSNKLLTYCQNNSSKIIELRHEEDSSYLVIKNQLVRDFQPLFDKLADKQSTLFSQIETRRQQANNDLIKINKYGILIILSIIVVTGLILFGLSHYIGEQIAAPVIKVKDILEKIAVGQLPKVEIDAANNEVSQMTNSLHILVDELENLRQFTNEVGSGNFDKEVVIFQNQGEIASSLYGMKVNLKKASEVERIQNWTASGLAELGKILRKNYDTSADLYNEVLSYLVRYLKANQGSFFIVEDQVNNTQLELVACWAYNRKKFVQKTLNIGEGLVGQVYLERDIIYMTQIPDNYIKITSGLGEATPKHLFIFPLINNDKVQGVIELASFNKIEDYQQDFLKQFADVMASEIIAEKVNTRTTKLLKQSQEQAEEMRAQEEELRQNMEEMQATQEEVQRKGKEIEKILAESNSILEGISMTMIVAELSVEGNFISTNENFNKVLKFPPAAIIGKHHVAMVPPERKNSEAYEQNWATMRAGKSVMGVYLYKTALGEMVWFNAVYSPVFDENNNVQKIMLFATDVTAQKAKEAEVDVLLQTSVAQEEELRQSMEELAANQENIQRLFNEVQNKERYLHELINSSSDSIMVVDTEYKLLSFNNTLRNSYTGIEVTEGTNIFDLLPPAEHTNYKATYDRSLKKGEKFSETTHYQMDGINAYFFAQYTPLYDQNNEIMAVSVFAKDISEMVIAKQNAENIAAQFESQNKALEEQQAQLHLSMEELSANQENIEGLLNDVQSKERYLHELINSSTDSVTVIDTNYKLLTFNNTLKNAFVGIDVKEGMSIFDLIVPTEHTKYKATYDRCIKDGERFSDTVSFQIDGFHAYYFVQYTPLYDQNGEVMAVSIFSKDVSEMVIAKQNAENIAAQFESQNKALEEQQAQLHLSMEELSANQENIEGLFKDLQDKESYLHELINASNDSIMVIDQNYNLKTFNNALVQAYQGLEVKEGKSVLELLPAADHEAYKATYDRVLKAGETFSETTHLQMDKIDAYFTAKYTPIRNTDNQIIAVAIIAKDVSELERCKQKNQELKLALGESNTK